MFLATPVLKPNSNDPGVQAGHLDQLLLPERNKVSCHPSRQLSSERVEVARGCKMTPKFKF